MTFFFFGRQLEFLPTSKAHYDSNRQLSERYLGRQGPHRSICHSRIGPFITQLTCAYIMRNGEPNAPIL